MRFATYIEKSRRTALLRLTHEAGGHANESVLQAGLHALGFSRTGRPEVRQDLEWLAERGLIAIEWFADKVMVARLSERGLDAAHGRGEPVEGIEWPDLPKLK